MAEKAYIVVHPIKVAGDKKGTFKKVTGGTVAMDDADAAPLIACGALREPDVVEEDEPAKK
jgi:hypothetical protein